MNRHQRRAAEKRGRLSYSRPIPTRDNLAIELIRQGRFDEAIGRLEVTLNFRPDYPEAHNNLGYALEQLGRTNEALQHYERAIFLKPDYPEALNNAGNVFRERGCPTEAISHYRRAIEIKPDDATAHTNLAAILTEQHKFPEALTEFETAISLRPDYLGAHLGLGLLQAELGMRDEAIAAANNAIRLGSMGDLEHYFLGLLFAKCELRDLARDHLHIYLQYDPQDRRGARMMLATLGEALPERAPDSFIDGLYTKRAASWDESITKGDKTYRGDVLVAEALEQLADNELNILDAGCGTGLVGARIRHRASQLVGVDLSEAMLAQAKEKGVYDQLHCADLVSHMISDPQHYDVITSAATLIHFGDLRPVFQAAANRLRDGGLFVFTLFPNADPDEVTIHPSPGLARGGCYAHGRDFVVSIAKLSGFDVEILRDDIHEFDPGQPRLAMIVALRRRHEPVTPGFS
jgi:predicted TPR repeat methyltransferase